MRTLLASVLAASLLLVSSPSRAQDDDDVPPPDPRTHLTRSTHWYGYETLATDGAALALAVPALASSASGIQSVFGVGSVMTYGLGAPIVHAAHGQTGKALADLGIRVGMPLVLGFFGEAIGSGSYQQSGCRASDPGFCGLGNALGQVGAAAEGAVIGGLLGIGGAVVIDAALLAREPVTHVASPATAHIEPAFGVAPDRRGGTRATLGMIGTF
jgi:hypothetical protein